MRFSAPIQSRKSFSNAAHNLFQKFRENTEKRTKHKAIIGAKIDPQVYAKNIAKLALRKEVNSLKFKEIFNPEQREKTEINMKVKSL